jgi:DNA-binding transcriptional MerR regulator
MIYPMPSDISAKEPRHRGVTMSKAAEAFRTISEVAAELDVQKHVLRFWEARFPQVRPMKRGGGRRYYRPEDMELLRGIRHLLHAEGYTIKGVQKILREQGIDHVKQYGRLAAPDAKAEAAQGKRGRPAAHPQVLPGRAPESAIAVGRSGPQRDRPGAVQGQAIIEAAIRELGMCRKVLLETVGKKEAPRPVRRARAVGA